MVCEYHLSLPLFSPLPLPPSPFHPLQPLPWPHHHGLLYLARSHVEIALLVCLASVIDTFKALGNWCFMANWVDHDGSPCDSFYKKCPSGSSHWSMQPSCSRAAPLCWEARDPGHLWPSLRKTVVWVASHRVTLSAIMANHPDATPSRVFQPGWSASHSPNPSTGLGIPSEHRGGESAWVWYLYKKRKEGEYLEVVMDPISPERSGPLRTSRVKAEEVLWDWPGPHVNGAEARSSWVSPRPSAPLQNSKAMVDIRYPLSTEISSTNLTFQKEKPLFHGKTGTKWTLGTGDAWACCKGFTSCSPFSLRSRNHITPVPSFSLSSTLFFQFSPKSGQVDVKF